MAGTNRIQLGSAVVTRVVEWQFELRSSLFDQTPASGWQDNADLLVPTFFNPDTDRWRVAIQSWVIEVDGLTVVVDTGAGNGRQRPHMPPLDHLDTGFLDDVRAAGFDYNDVDVVINTHIHSDHVGWNTKLENGTWVPTFPNARYLMPAPDYRFFHPDGPAAKSVPRTEHEQKRLDGTRFVFEDSIIPIEAAGQIVQWSQDYRVSDSLRLRAAEGHTPGSSVLWLDAGPQAVFVGDLTHSPIQLRRPADACAFDVDPIAAAATRKRVLTEAARTRAVVIPAHYPGHGGATIRANDDRFDIDEWLELDLL